MAILILSLLLQTAQDDPARLVLQLGSENIAERDEAERRLIELGEKSEAAVREALGSSDPEIAGRARAIWDRQRDLRETREWDQRIRALPETFADRKYALKGKKEQGRWTMKTRKDGDRLVLEDRVESAQEGKSETIRAVMTCMADRTLNLVKAETDYTREGSTTRARAELKDGKMTGQVGDAKVEFQPGSPSLPWYAIFRLVSALPQREGFRLEFEYVVATNLHQYKTNTLTCLGEKEVEWEGKRLRVWEWEQSGSSRHWVIDHRHVRTFSDAGGWEIVFDGAWP